MHHSFTTKERTTVSDACAAMLTDKLLNVRVPIEAVGEVWVGKVVAVRAEADGHTITMDF